MAVMFLFIFHLFSLPVNDAGHAVYVSVLEITKSDREAADLKIKVFTDDLEDAVFNQQGKRINLQNGNCDQFKEEVSHYFFRHLTLIIDGKKVTYDYLSCEINDISIWFTFRLQAPEKWSEVAVEADYLMELFPTQSNIVSITYEGNKRMFRLLKGDTKAAVNF